MSRRPNIINESQYSSLRELVRKKSGLSCNSFSDILQLQLHIKKITGQYLSLQTLNRIFGLIKSEFHPSAFTLDVIAQYLNYDSFDKFVNIYHQPAFNLEMSEQTADMLKILFSGINPMHGNEICLCKLCLNVYKMIYRNENIAHEIYSILAETSFGRKYIFENYVYIDKLNGHYGEGIEFYILHAKAREEFLFGQSLLCLQSFLKNEQEEFEFHFNKIRDFSLFEINTFSSNVIVRYGAALIFNEVIRKSNNPINGKSAAIIKLISAKKYENFEDGLDLVILAEALLLAGAYEEVLQILFNPKTKYCKACNETEEMALSNQIDLLKLYAGISSKKISYSNIRQRIQSFNDVKFHFLSNDFYTLLLNQLIELVGNTKDVKIAKKMHSNLIAKTGFTFFNDPVQELLFQ